MTPAGEYGASALPGSAALLWRVYAPRFSVIPAKAGIQYAAALVIVLMRSFVERLQAIASADVYWVPLSRG